MPCAREGRYLANILEVPVKKLSIVNRLALAFLAFSVALLVPSAVSAQQQNGDGSRLDRHINDVSRFQQTNVPAEARQAEDAVERAVRRFRIGVSAGAGLDPELIMFGAHGAFGPIFNRNVEFRPGVEFGVGEVTTSFGINLDVLYILPGTTRGARWTPYVGGGPNFSLSHRGFDSDGDDDDNDDNDDRNRFDFSDTDFEPGFNFFAGARTQNGMFLEMKSTAYGVSKIRILVGFNF
jgi:hypothetical protein